MAKESERVCVSTLEELEKKDHISFNFRGHDLVIFQRHRFLDVRITNYGSNLTAVYYENREGKGKDHFSIIKVR